MPLPFLILVDTASTILSLFSGRAEPADTSDSLRQLKVQSTTLSKLHGR